MYHIAFFLQNPVVFTPRPGHLKGSICSDDVYIFSKLTKSIMYSTICKSIHCCVSVVGGVILKVLYETKSMALEVISAVVWSPKFISLL